MPNLNKVMLIGNLTRDPEQRFMPNGKAVAKFGLAINREWKTESGEKKQDVVFIDVDAFGKQAEVITQYVKKGHPLFVEGRLKLDQWEDKKTGQRVNKIGVVLESFQFLKSGEKQSGEQAERPAARQAESRTAEPAAAQSDDGGEDEVPF